MTPAAKAAARLMTVWAEQEGLREAGARIAREIRVEEYLRRRALRATALAGEENGGAE